VRSTLQAVTTKSSRKRETEQLDKPKEPALEALPLTDSSAIGALAEHLGVALQDIEDWLRRPGGVPHQVLLSWIALWKLRRLTSD
jgi:hypothetical protein